MAATKSKQRKPPRRKTGPKPRSGDEASKLFSLRITDAEHARWKAAAKLADTSVSEWLRRAAESAIKKR